ncbi:hypothetical protein Dimus_020161 [Dionaea muscipula]
MSPMMGLTNIFSSLVLPAFERDGEGGGERERDGEGERRRDGEGEMGFPSGRCRRARARRRWPLPSMILCRRLPCARSREGGERVREREQVRGRGKWYTDQIGSKYSKMGCEF